jgi:hypothetical protein
MIRGDIWSQQQEQISAVCGLMQAKQRMLCGADERLVQQVEGLRCDCERHMTWVDVEPTTGEACCYILCSLTLQSEDFRCSCKFAWHMTRGDLESKIRAN